MNTLKAWTLTTIVSVVSLGFISHITTKTTIVKSNDNSMTTISFSGLLCPDLEYAVFNENQYSMSYDFNSPFVNNPLCPQPRSFENVPDSNIISELILDNESGEIIKPFNDNDY